MNWNQVGSHRFSSKLIQTGAVNLVSAFRDCSNNDSAWLPVVQPPWSIRWLADPQGAALRIGLVCCISMCVYVQGIGDEIGLKQTHPQPLEATDPGAPTCRRRRRRCNFNWVKTVSDLRQIRLFFPGLRLNLKSGWSQSNSSASLPKFIKIYFNPL